MANREKIDYLLSDIKKLEERVLEMRDAEVYPVSFFSKTFDLTHKILNDLHILEADQIDFLNKQMEEHQALIRSIPVSKAKPHPVLPVPVDKNIEEPGETDQYEKTDDLSIKPDNDKQTLSLHDLIEKKNLSDFRKALSLNDRFYFRRELFNGDEAKMNKVITDLNDIHSLQESLYYLNQKLNWDMQNDIVAEFIKLLEKRFI